MWTMLMTHHTTIPMRSTLAMWTQRLLEHHKLNSNILRAFADTSSTYDLDRISY